MEGLFYSCSVQDLKSYCKGLSLKHGGIRETLIKTLLAFLKTPGSRRRAEGSIPTNILLEFDRLSQQQASPMPNDPSLSCICIAGAGVGPLIACSKCCKSQHIICMSLNSSTSPYLCPFCMLSRLNPLDFPVNTLLNPWKLTQYLGNGLKTQILEYTSQIPHTIHGSEGDYQVQMRCIRLDGKTEHMTWPSRGYLIVNNKIAMRFSVSSNPNAKIRKDVPLNITSILTLGRNSIGVLVDNEPHVYAAALFLVLRKSELSFIREIKNNDVVSLERGQEFVKKILGAGNDDVMLDSIKISLVCPITKSLLETPVRGGNCTHIQCFSLESYVGLQRTSTVNRWKCPICTKFVYEISVDLFMTEILEKARKSGQECEVEIFCDANYKISCVDRTGGRNQEKEEDALPLKRNAETRTLSPVKIPHIHEID